MFLKKLSFFIIGLSTICVLSNASSCSSNQNNNNNTPNNNTNNPGSGSTGSNNYTSNLPSYSCLKSHYLRYGNNIPVSEDVIDPALGDLLGGYVEYNIDAGIFLNTCAIRVSHMLNSCGHTIPYIADQTSSSANNDKNIYRVVIMEDYLTNRYGPAQITSSNKSSFIGEKGILLIHMPGTWSDATGHVALWDGQKTLGGFATDNFMFANAQYAKLWVAN